MQLIGRSVQEGRKVVIGLMHSVEAGLQAAGRTCRDVELEGKVEPKAA
jgi:hypothetical protein